ncbi:EAL domain-containing protein [uncultured Desulfuromonas sp.]|uniref:sensor domain-containing protein n=1 Tax=uncultured Desulfuromonas sp. TaxID=181013 RepID=UPI002AAC434B|nr:EAL domain-containing protein [uncultured Desulfuromonas sp.]
MNNSSALKSIMSYRRVAVMLTVVFCLFIGLAGLMSSMAREKQLEQALQQSFNIEQDLLVSMVSEALLRSDYVQVRKMLNDYFEKHPEYVAISLTSPNGFAVFSATRPVDSDNAFRAAKKDLHSNNVHEGVLELKKQDQLKGLWWLENAGILGVVVALPLFFLAALVWLVVKKLGLDPLYFEAKSQAASYEALFEQSKEAILILSETGEIEKLNPEAVNLFNISPNSLPVHLGSFHSPESFLSVQQFIDKTRQEGFCCDVVHQADQDLYLEVIASLMTVKGAQKIQLLIHDVSDVHRYKEKLESLSVDLKNSLRTYQDLFNTVADGLVVRDINGHMLMANQAFLSLLGYQEEELIGSHCTQVCKNENCDRFGEILQGRTIVFKCLHKTKNGEEIPVEVNSTLVSFRGKTAVLSSVRDIRDRLAKEGRLKQLMTVVENSNDGVLVTDVAGTIIAVNNAFCKISGYTKEEVLGSNPRMFQSAVHGRAFYHDMWEELEKHGQWQGEIWNRNKSGESYPEMLSIRALTDDTGDVYRYVGIFTDLSNEKALEQKVLHLAQTDPLTGMANRVLFRDRLQQAIKHAQRNVSTLAVYSLGLDHFKKINDSLGHAIGDKILIEVARRLKSCLREEDTFCRHSGDEFTLMTYCGADGLDASAVANKILEAIRLPFVADENELFMTASIGIALFPKDSSDDLGLMQKAENAMHQSKKKGRDCHCYFSREFSQQAEETLHLTTLLHKALERQELQLYYQPQVDLENRRIVAAEALLRWHNDELGWVSPVRMIPIAEESGLILPIGQWVLEQAAKQIRSHYETKRDWLPIAVNISVKQFVTDDFIEMVKRIIEKHDIPARCMELELTESLMLADIDLAIKKMGELHALGVPLALDDFGTGYTSLAYLKRFPVDKIKLDRAFVTDIHHSKGDAALAKSLVAFTREMEFELIAEGIEEEIQGEYLKAMGFRYGQGYLYSKPLPQEEFAKLFSIDMLTA